MSRQISIVKLREELHASSSRDSLLAWLSTRPKEATGLLPDLFLLLQSIECEQSIDPECLAGAIAAVEFTHLQPLLALADNSGFAGKMCILRVLRKKAHLRPQTLTSSLPFLLTVIDDADTILAAEAIDVMASMKSHAASIVPLLMKRLKVTSSRSRQSDIIYVFENIGVAAQEAIDVLISIFKKAKNDYIQYRVALALGAIGKAAKQAIPHLVTRLSRVGTKSDLLAPDAIVLALQQIGGRGQRLLANLSPFLDDKDLDFRLRVADCMWTFQRGNQQALMTVISVLQHGNSSQTGDAALVLEAWGPAAKLAISALEAASKQADDYIQACATRALEAIQKR